MLNRNTGMLTKILRTALVVTLIGSSAFIGATALGAKPRPTASGPTLETIKRLAGDWVQVDENGELTDRVVSKYRVTAGGSAVLEILFPGSSHEMVTVYHQDGDELMLTHYCVLGNQPRMRAKKDAEAGTLVFECFDITNVASRDAKHMNKGVVRLISDDHLKSTWYSVEKGEVVYKAEFNIKRRAKPKANAAR